MLWLLGHGCWHEAGKLNLQNAALWTPAVLWEAQCQLLGATCNHDDVQGVFSSSLAEWALFACSYFAKDLPRMLAQQRACHWEKYNVEELR